MQPFFIYQIFTVTKNQDVKKEKKDEKQLTTSIDSDEIIIEDYAVRQNNESSEIMWSDE